MKPIAIFASIAFASLLGCTDAGPPADRTGEVSPPARMPAPSEMAAKTPEMSEADRALAKRVEDALRQNAALASAADNVQVYANNGEVTLRGSVSNEQEKTNLGSAAGQVAGVSKVNNEIEIASASR